MVPKTRLGSPPTDHGRAEVGCPVNGSRAKQNREALAPLEAAVAAKNVASEAVRDALTDIGAGTGPVDALGIAARRQAPDRAHT